MGFRFITPAVSAMLLATSLMSLMPHQAQAASFDCAKKELAADEKAICEDRTLNDLDVKMVTTFDILTGLVPMGNRDTLRDEQSAWLKTRQACAADASCIKSAYEERLKQLDAAYKSLIRPL